ncbi:MAG: peptidoglycan DD-metalloendopeptidase family protein [Deltaproteobacteria bacterium]|nr:peptidoglycan DD-metalloendopeptidase family protein [Deltaproteobacteria bacterium]
MKLLNNKNSRSTMLVLTVILICCPPLLYADELTDSKNRLEELEKKITITLENLRDKQGQAGTLNKDLDELKNEINRIDKKVKLSSKELEQLNARLSRQQQQLETTQQQLDTTHQQLKKRLIALYKVGDTGFFRALLSTSVTPQALAEKYLFLSRIARHDRQLMDAYRQQAQSYQTRIEELEALRVQQTSLAKRFRREQQALNSARKMKAQLLAKVKQDEELLATILDELRAKANRLNDLVKKLESDQTQSYTGTLSGLFLEKGRLPWPLTGPVKVGFGTSRHNDYGAIIESHGLEISAPAGSEVSAVASGKVIYASPLRGYGKLMIIDHGGKDYSVYAQIAKFLKRVGDIVEGGENIAISGFEGRTSLYFEIRHRGKPEDPKDWLKPL